MTRKPTFDPGWARPLSRRTFLRGTGAMLGAAALAPILAACADKASGPFDGSASGRVDFANWPLYIDRKRDSDGQVVRPSMEKFTQATGIEVNYREVIPDAEIFYQQIQPYLAAGEPCGWDIAVITNGITLTKMMGLNQLMALPTDMRPNFDQYASDIAKGRTYDPGSQFSMPWQSGITGIGWNPDLTGGHPVSSLEQLFSGDLPGKVGLFSDNVDMPNIVMLAAGINPENSKEADWKHAADWLRNKIDRGLRVTFFKQNYINALSAGDVVASMAWSGDIYQENALGVPKGLQFATPTDGGLIWTDNMVIPVGAQHPVDAIRLMDFVYEPQIAAMITEWVAYITPVPQAKDQILARASTAHNPSTAKALTALADSPLVFLTAEASKELHSYAPLTPEQIPAWTDAFSRFIA
ncbi:MAG TPA: spermidine/putrescine ABC transporter substrate-binding protein [Actinomycetota bacterium]|nr:spermidine/putrescine ABC transporter substrate-binding protein [Actinomycetota bacterium]